MAGNVYHTMLIDSDVVVFYEATRGSFRKADMVIAPWAPADGDLAAIRHFQEGLRRTVEARVTTLAGATLGGGDR